MAQLNYKEVDSDVTTDAAAKMAKYGITRVPVDYYHYKEFRYTNLDDAIAQAKYQRTGS